MIIKLYVLHNVENIFGNNRMSQLRVKPSLNVFKDIFNLRKITQMCASKNITRVNRHEHNLLLRYYEIYKYMTSIISKVNIT